MSYLHTPRLVFTGDFLSDVSTINNDTQHYNNDTFECSFQKPGPSGTNGWWNPEGGAVFNFQGCSVKQMLDKDGNPITENFQGIIVAGADGRATGKMVDLDPDAQMYSQLWAVQLRVINQHNELMLEGTIDPVGFRDLQRRQTEGVQRNGQPLGASWTSVLTNLIWGPGSANSPFMRELREVTQNNQLSLNLNGFGYYYAHNDGRFSLGRILGTIGPWFLGEPSTFTACRRLYGVHIVRYSQRSDGSYSAIVLHQYSNFLFSAEKQSLTLDLGNSLPIADPLGLSAVQEPLVIAVSTGVCETGPQINTGSPPPVSPPVVLPESDYVIIGELGKPVDSWLMDTGGIVTFSNLSIEICNLLANHQLLLFRRQADGSLGLLARESLKGIYFRADEFVQRLDNGETNEIHFYAYQWGRAFESATINFALQPPGQDTPKDSNSPPISITYGNNKPAEGLTLPDSTTTDVNGRAIISLTGNAIYSPRVYIDGQIYFIDYSLTGWIDPAAPDAGIENIVVHLRDAYKIPENPTWDDISPTMKQFANLYPIMSKYLVDLANPEAVVSKKTILKFAFSQMITSPLYMPVTRDLSEAKRLTILKWLDNPLPGTGQKFTAAVKPLGFLENNVSGEPGEKERRRKEVTAMKQGIDPSVNTDIIS